MPTWCRDLKARFRDLRRRIRADDPSVGIDEATQARDRGLQRGDRRVLGLLGRRPSEGRSDLARLPREVRRPPAQQKVRDTAGLRPNALDPSEK